MSDLVAELGIEFDASGVARFELPEIEGLLLGSEDVVRHMPTARELEELHRQAQEEGYATGQSAGYAAGYSAGESAARSQIDDRTARLDMILSQLGAPLATLDEEMVESVAELALLIARHLVRRELKAAPGEVIGVVRETMRLLPIASRSTTLHLNPDDVDLVRQAFALDTDGFNWRLEPDPRITRGGCLIETEASRIDATVESRIAAIASKMFGGERDSDRGAA